MSFTATDGLTILTPDECDVSGLREEKVQGQYTSSIPWQGFNYIIRSASTGKVLTFRGGRIVLGQVGGHEAMRWKCVEKKGWLGFQDPASSMFLGYDKREELCCSVKAHELWENFCVRQRPNGGYILLMVHYENFSTIAWKGLRPVGIKIVDGTEKLAVIDDWDSESTTWQFIKV